MALRWLGRTPLGGTISRLKLRAFLCAILVVIVAQMVAATGQGVARPAIGLRSPSDGPSVSFAARKLSATSVSGLLDAQVEITVHNAPGASLGVSASDFLVSAEGDIFGARAWNGGPGRLTIRGGETRVLSASFALPSDAINQATLL